MTINNRPSKYSPRKDSRPRAPRRCSLCVHNLPRCGDYHPVTGYDCDIERAEHMIDSNSNPCPMFEAVGGYA